MNLSKKAKKGISAFNRARNPLYSGFRVPLWDDKTASFVDAYLALKEKQLDDSINGQDGEVAGKQVS